MSYTDVVVEIDEKVKEEADKVFSSLGYTIEEAIDLFLKLMIQEGNIDEAIDLFFRVLRRDDKLFSKLDDTIDKKGDFNV